MKTRFIILIVTCLIVNRVYAQDSVAVNSGVDDFLKAPGKIIVNNTVIEDRFTGTSVIFISLFKCYDFGKSDTMYGVKFKSTINSNLLTAIIDTDELPKIIKWIELIRKGGVWTYNNNFLITYAPNRCNLLLQYTKDSFVLQMNVFDDNSNIEFSISKLDEMYLYLKKLQSILLNLPKSNRKSN